ncbi:MAG TPA: AMP-binding protein, partial [Burkholderiaceae bacterium]|nr:AMP-binding protein [Burkholderiaceae bacterium]
QLAGHTGLGDVLSIQASRPEVANASALYFRDDVYTYAELNAACERAAANLRARAIGNGDSVALALPNAPALVAHLFGILKIGATVVPLNPSLTIGEVSWLINASGARALVTTVPLAQQLDAVRNTPALRHLVVIDPAQRLDCTLSTAKPSAGGDGTAFLIFTSGTTGRPKGVMVTHRNVLANTAQVAERTAVTPHDRVLNVMPLFHANGLMNNTILPLRAGASIVLRPRFEPDEFWGVVKRFRPTYFTAVPTMFTRLMDGWKTRADTTSLRFVRSGAAPMVPALQRLVEERLGVPVVLSYGLSEATCTCTMNPPDRSRRIASVGPALADEAVVAVDADGRPMARGQVGEIAVCGPNVMAGYFNAPDETSAVLRDGWLHTGDMGFVDPDGFVFLTDRKKDLIIRGGENISPREVEEALLSFPAVAEAAVVGTPDREWGEEVVAFVVPRTDREIDVDALQAFCHERLARFKVPRRLRVVASLPLTSVGKMDKARLRALACQDATGARP